MDWLAQPPHFGEAKKVKIVNVMGEIMANALETSGGHVPHGNLYSVFLLDEYFNCIPVLKLQHFRGMPGILPQTTMKISLEN